MPDPLAVLLVRLCMIFVLLGLAGWLATASPPLIPLILGLAVTATILAGFCAGWGS